MKNNMISAVRITMGAVLYGMGVSLFLDPNSLAPGGVVGISIILNRFVGISTGTLYFLINIPILLLGFWKLGSKLIFKSMYAIVVNTLVTNVLAQLEPVTTAMIPAALAGSLLLGSGISLVFRGGATTGGMDIIVKLLRKRYPHLKTGSLFLMLDITVVAISAVVFGDFDRAMYALIAVFITGRMIDRLLYGSDEAKLIFIVSDKAETVAKTIMEQVKTGITFLKGQGAYHNKEKKIILCVIRKQTAPKVLEVVKQTDPGAFTIISSAAETFGEGYKDFFQEAL